jgi:hypothetical protein
MVMKALKSFKVYSIFAGLLGLAVIFSSAYAQEYDDMYFNKSDRKTVKVQSKALTKESKSLSNSDYNSLTESTEVYSAKNVNPEYIARYKATESNEVQEQVVRNGAYNSDDYFIEDYNVPDSAIGSHQNQIDYAALNKRDQMSYSNYNSANSFYGRNPYMGFSPYMSMGYGMPFGYDPFMMGYGYGPGMSMGIGYGFGSGFYPSMSYSISMSWGTGYNPWGGWGAYPYSPYSMRGFYDPWGWGYPSYAYRGFSPYYGAWGMGSYYGYSRPYYTANSYHYYDNGSTIKYQPRTAVRSATTPRSSQRNTENIRVSSADSKIRVPNRTTSTGTSNGRVSRDYSKTQNEYYSRARTSASSQRISTSNSSRNSYARTSGSSSSYSSISNNRPSRISNSSSGYNRSSSSYSNGSRSSSSYSSPARSTSGSSSFNRSNYSGSSGSGYSSGSRTSSSSSSSGSRSSSSSGSRSGGRQ